MPDRFRTAIAVLAILSMSLGNVVALAQRDIKRLLAYSGIAHMGYVTIALAIFGRDALAAVIVYFFAYVVSNAGAFAAVAALYRDETKPHPVGLLAGAGHRSPFAAAVLALCMFSLAGIPATAGFIGKFFVFKSAIEGGFYALAIVGVVNSLVSIGYYLKVVYILYMREPVEEGAPPRLAIADRLVLGALRGRNPGARHLSRGRLELRAQRRREPPPRAMSRAPSKPSRESKEPVSEATASRLSVYVRCLAELEGEGREHISSQELARRFHLNSPQIRKDLATFGEFGIRGVGYSIGALKRHLISILGLDQVRRVAIVGAGYPLNSKPLLPNMRVI